VEAVADNFGKQFVVGEDFAEKAGFAVIEAAHGVVGVGRGDGSGVDATFCGGGVGVAVAKADADSEFGGVGDRFFSAGKLGSDGHEADMAFSSLPEAIEEGGRWGEELILSMGAAFVRREEWAFEVNAQRTSAGDGGAEERGEAGEGTQERIERSGDGSGEVSSYTATGEEDADVVERGVGGLHGVVAAAAVDVDVEESGNEGAVGEFDVAARRQLGGGLRSDADDGAVFDEDDGMLDGFRRGDEALRGQYGTHEKTEYSGMMKFAWGGMGRLILRSVGRGRGDGDAGGFAGLRSDAGAALGAAMGGASASSRSGRDRG